MVKFVKLRHTLEITTKKLTKDKSENCVKIPKSNIVLWKIAKVSLWKTPYITRRLSSTWVLEWKFVSYKSEVQVSFIGGSVWFEFVLTFGWFFE